ncbi:MAG: hypothetical protein ACI8UG_002558 [Gammaproteobacteria bacterium]|jgi:hypothetical protein
MPINTQKSICQLENLPKPREVSGVNSETFNEQVLEYYEPVVLRGFASDWEIVHLANNSLDAVANYLCKHDSGKTQRLVTTPAAANGRMFYNENLDGMNFSVQQTSLSSSIKQMLRRPEGHGSENHCIQSVSVRDNLPLLEEKFPNHVLKNSTRSFIWIGNQMTVAPHFDEASNIAVVAAGKRRFTFFPPEQIKNLYIGPLDFTPSGQPISLVNLRDPDLKRFPRYEEAYKNAMSVELNPGDAIYIPSPWWHHVESLSKFNVLVNYWWSNAYVSSALPFPMLIHAIQALKNLPQGQVNAWESILEHYLFDRSVDPAAHLPAGTAGILGDLTPQKATHLHKWLVNQLG